MPQSPKVTRENKPIISINSLCEILLICLELLRGLQSGKCWKLVMEDPWSLLGFSFTPSCCRDPCVCPAKPLWLPAGSGAMPGPTGFVLRVQIPSLHLPVFTSKCFSSYSMSGGLLEGFLPWGSLRTPLQGWWGCSSSPRGPVEPQGAPLLTGLDGLVSLKVEMF